MVRSTSEMAQRESKVAKWIGKTIFVLKMDPLISHRRLWWTLVFLSFCNLLSFSQKCLAFISSCILEATIKAT